MATKGRVQVAPGQTIASADWGNPLWDQSIQCFDTLADANNQYPQASRHPGAMIYTDDTDSLYLWLGARWQQLSAAAGFDQVSGALVVGAFDGTKPIRHLYRRFNTTSDAAGLISFAFTTTAILFMGATVETPNTPPAVLLARSAETTTTQVTFQARATTTGNPIGSTAILGQQHIVFQT